MNPHLFSYANEVISWDEQVAAGVKSVRHILGLVGGIPEAIDRELPAYLGRSRAEAGVPADELLRALNIDFEMCWSALTDDEAQLSKADVMTVGADVWRAIESYSNSVLLAYKQREYELHRAIRLHTDATIAHFLAREDHHASGIRSGVEALGIDPDRRIHTLVSSRTIEEVEQAFHRGKRAGRLRVTALAEGTYGLWQPTSRSTQPFPSNLVATIHDLPESLELVPASLHALRDAVRACAPRERTSVALVDTWAAQILEDVAKRSRYVPEARLGRFSKQPAEAQRRARDVIEALGSEMSVSAAARTLHIHRNTLLQRIAQIERHTGFDIRVPNDLFELRLLLTALRHDADGDEH